MVTFDVNIAELATLLAIIVRLGVVLFMLPIFNSTHVPRAFKALVVVSFSVMLFPIVHGYTRPLPFDPGALAPIIVGELIFGVLFSLSMLLIVSAFQFAGDLISFMMGFGFAQTASPDGKANDSVLSALTQLMAFIIFLSINGHLTVIALLVHSFKTIPVGSFAMSSDLFKRMVLLSGTLFILAVKLAAPALAVLLLTHIGLGLMAKFAPQMNVIATSFPLTITIGMVFFSITLVPWGRLGIQYFDRLFDFLKYFSR
ncbi:MAG: flagellar biosynthetic protein FliR [Syntrophobacteraceae bacterium]